MNLYRGEKRVVFRLDIASLVSSSLHGSVACSTCMSRSRPLLSIINEHFLLKPNIKRLPKTPRHNAQNQPPSLSQPQTYSKNPITNLSASKISPPQTTNNSRSVRTVSQPRAPSSPGDVESNLQSQILLTGAFCTFPPFFFSSRRSTSGCALPRLAASLRA